VLGKKLGIDLGSTAVRVRVRGEEAVISEPAVAAIGAQGRVLGVGTQALVEAERNGAELCSPLDRREVADVRALHAIVQHLITRAVGRQRIFKPEVMAAVPSAMGGRSRREVLEAATLAGARTVYLVDVPLAAAIGAGLAVTTRVGHLVVDIGGDLTEVAVVAQEGTVVSRCLDSGGRQLTADIAAHLSARCGTAVGDAAAEDAKVEIGSAVPLQEERTLRLLPSLDGDDGEEIIVSSAEVEAAMAGGLRELAAAAREALDECPPRLLADITERTGMVLTGGGALLRGIDRYLAAATGVRARVASAPQTCTARGIGAAPESLDVVRRNFLYVR